MLTGVEIVTAVAGAVQIVKDSPAAMKVLRKLGTNLGIIESHLVSPPDLRFNEEQPITRLTMGFVGELNDLVDQYHRKSGEWAAPEREDYQLRVASKACRLLCTAEPLLKDVLEGFDAMKELFCGIANAAQKQKGIAA